METAVNPQIGVENAHTHTRPIHKKGLVRSCAEQNIL